MGGISIDIGSLITHFLVSFSIATGSSILTNTMLDVPKAKHKYMFLFNYFMYIVITIPATFVLDNANGNLSLWIIINIYNILKAITIFAFTANLSGQSYIKATIAGLGCDTINTVLIVLPYIVLPRAISGDYSTTNSFPSFRPYFIIIQLAIIIVYTLLYQLTQNYLQLYASLKFKHSWFWWGVYLLYTFGSIVQYKSSEYEEMRSWIFIFAITGLLLIFTIIQIAWAIRIQLEKHLLLENMELHKERAIMREYYATLALQLERTKLFQANIENHQKLLTTISTNKQELSIISEYTNDLLDKYNTTQPNFYCDNILINAILYNKQMLCDKKNISMNAKVHSLPNTGLTDASFATLLSISLDAMINSHISDITDNMNVTIGNVADDLSIKIKMIYQTQTTADFSFENDLSSNTNLIEELLEPANGSMQYKFEQNSCSLIIMIPGKI